MKMQSHRIVYKTITNATQTIGHWGQDSYCRLLLKNAEKAQKPQIYFLWGYAYLPSEGTCKVSSKSYRQISKSLTICAKSRHEKKKICEINFEL